MTNRKFKDYQKNRLAFIAILRNYELLCTILLTLNKEFPKQFYSKRCIEWIDTYAISTHTLTWSVTYYRFEVFDDKRISTHTLTWSVTFRTHNI